MSDQATQITLRDALESNMTASQEGTMESAVNAPDIQTSETTRLRDEAGKFSAKPAESTAEPQKTESTPEAQTNVTAAPEPVQSAPEVQRPTTWKKEYLPTFDKLLSGGVDGVVTLTADEARKLAAYSGQREKEYATGVSTYKAEAQNAKNLQGAIAPFIPDLQKFNIAPETWIQNLGNAHKVLSLGSAEQKLAMFSELSRQYGIPLAAVNQTQDGQTDPVVTQLMDHIQKLEGKVNTVAGWREKQEQEALNNQLAPFQDAAKYPHFEQVRTTMAQILESGLAPDLDAAYQKSLQFHPDVWEEEQSRQALLNQPRPNPVEKVAAAAKAKTNAISVKSAAPSGDVATTAGKKDLRSALEANFAATSGRV